MKCALKLHTYFSVRLPRKVDKCRFLGFFSFFTGLSRISEVYIHSQSFYCPVRKLYELICVSCCEPVGTVFPHELLWQPIPVLSRGSVCCFSIEISFLLDPSLTNSALGTRIMHSVCVSHSILC